MPLLNTTLPCKHPFTRFEKNVYKLLNCPFKIDVYGFIITITWTGDHPKVKRFVYNIDLNKYALNPDDFEIDIITKLEAYIKGDIHGKS